MSARMIKSRVQTSLNRPREVAPTWRLIAQIAVIIIATLIVYLPSLHGDFVWDDELLITRNPLLQTWSGLGEIWSFGRTADYFPLTNTIFWIEWHLFGTATAGYHWMNIVLQIADALLLWRLLTRLGVSGAWLAGLIFAVHPVHAESVAWISELKNVLSMFWALVSVLLFLRFVDCRTAYPRTTYVFSLVSFVLALLAKTQVVFLPDRDVSVSLVAGFRNRASNGLARCESSHKQTVGDFTGSCPGAAFFCRGDRARNGERVLSEPRAW